VGVEVVSAEVLVDEGDMPWVLWGVVVANNVIDARALVISPVIAPRKAGVLNARATDIWLVSVLPPSTSVKTDEVSNVTSVER